MDINILNSFLGYGDFRNADVLVLSKHEGAHNALIDKELEVRIDHFGLEKENWLDKENQLNGYWHPSARSAGHIKRQIIGGVDGGGAAPLIVNYSARIIQALEEAFEDNTEANMDQWFNNLGNDSVVDQKLHEKMGTLFGDEANSGWKATLSHYQPLPRQNNTWPYPEYQRKDFTKVFSNCEQPDNPKVIELRKKREDVFSNLLKEYPKKLILCTGNFNKDIPRDALRSFFEREFQTTFKGFRVKGKVRGLTGTFTYGDHKTVLVHTQRFGFGGGLNLNELRLITKQVYRLLKETEVPV